MKYGDVKGSIVLREAIAGFYNDHIVPLAPVEARHVAVVNGASSMVDVLFHCKQQHCLTSFLIVSTQPFVTRAMACCYPCPTMGPLTRTSADAHS